MCLSVDRHLLCVTAAVAYLQTLFPLWFGRFLPASKAAAASSTASVFSRASFGAQEVCRFDCLTVCLPC